MCLQLTRAGVKTLTYDLGEYIGLLGKISACVLDVGVDLHSDSALEH